MATGNVGQTCVSLCGSTTWGPQSKGPKRRTFHPENRHDDNLRKATCDMDPIVTWEL